MDHSVLLSFSPPTVVPTTQTGHNPPADTVGAFDLIRGLSGFAFLGLAGAMGGDESLRAAPAALTTGVGMLLLTLPALLVGHQLLGLKAEPATLVVAMARVFARCGDIGLAAVGVVVLFSATSSLGPLVFAMVSAGIGILGFALVIRQLVRIENNAFSMFILTVGWALLAALIGARIFLPFLF